MAATKATSEVPVLPACSIDFDALEKACAEGKSHEDIIAIATAQEADALPEKPAVVPAKPLSEKE